MKYPFVIANFNGVFQQSWRGKQKREIEVVFSRTAKVTYQPNAILRRFSFENHRRTIWFDVSCSWTICPNLETPTAWHVFRILSICNSMWARWAICRPRLAMRSDSGCSNAFPTRTNEHVGWVKLELTAHLYGRFQWLLPCRVCVAASVQMEISSDIFILDSRWLSAHNFVNMY
jgi:hypothetical protein